VFVLLVGVVLFRQLGCDEGARFVGLIFNLGLDLSDEALHVVDNIGDDIVKAGVELSDDASEGVGVLAKSVEPEQALSFSDELMTLCGAVGYARGAGKLAALALAGSTSDCVNQVAKIIGELDEAAQQGLNKLCKSVGGKDMAALAKKYSGTDELANAFRQTLSLSTSDPKFASWTSKASAETLDELVNFTSIYDEAYSKSLLTRLCQTDCTKAMFDEEFGNILRFVKNDETVVEMIGEGSPAAIKNGMVEMLRKLNIPDSLKGEPYYRTFRGWQFELDRAKLYFGQGRLETVHEGFRTFEGNTRYYDLVLDNNVVIEAKYWSRQRIEKEYDRLLRQIIDQADANNTAVIAVEFASTADNLRMTDDLMIQLRDELYELYGSRVIIDIIDYMIP